MALSSPSPCFKYPRRRSPSGSGVSRIGDRFVEVPLRAGESTGPATTRRGLVALRPGSAPNRAQELGWEGNVYCNREGTRGHRLILLVNPQGWEQVTGAAFGVNNCFSDRGVSLRVVPNVLVMRSLRRAAGAGRGIFPARGTLKISSKKHFSSAPNISRGNELLLDEELYGGRN